MLNARHLIIPTLLFLLLGCSKEEELQVCDEPLYSNSMLLQGRWMLRMPDTMNPSTRWFFGVDGRFYRQDLNGNTIIVDEVDRWEYVDNDRIMISWTRYGDTTLEPPEPDSSLFTLTYLILPPEEPMADVAFLTDSSTFELHYGTEIFSGGEGPNEFPALEFRYE